jgi:hypothetical protein
LYYYRALVEESQAAAKRKNINDEKTVRYTETLGLWLRASRADDFRDVAGDSLQDDARKMGLWSLYYNLQRRSLFTVMCVWFWTFTTNRAFCRLPRDVLFERIFPLIFQPAYCPYCKQGTETYVKCCGCDTVAIPCTGCRADYAEKHPYEQFRMCSRCKGMACQGCVTKCPAQTSSLCYGEYCTHCRSSTCDYCRVRPEQLQVLEMADDGSSSSDHSSDSDGRDSSDGGSGSEPPSDAEEDGNGDKGDGN